MVLPDFKFEKELWEKGFTIIGIDEVGRGAFAGPLCVSGVAFEPQKSLQNEKYLLSLGINDSKKLSSKKREVLSKEIREIAVCVTTYIDVKTINEIGIGKANFLGMKEVAENLKLKTKNPFLLVDAFKIPDISLPQKGLIRGDSLSISIASASIIAKVERDNLMKSLSKKFPQYGFQNNKGYGTLFHRNAILKNGVSIHHRRAFCRKLV